MIRFEVSPPAFGVHGRKLSEPGKERQALVDAAFDNIGTWVSCPLPGGTQQANAGSTLRMIARRVADVSVADGRLHVLVRPGLRLPGEGEDN